MEESNWIKCEHGKMPEDILPYNKNVEHPIITVLVTTKNGKVTVVQRSLWNYWSWSRGLQVIAWQPLPKAYKEK